VLSGLFTISLIGLLFVAIALLRSTGQASLSSLLLLTTPWIPFFATAQNAEIPLAYFYLAVGVLLILYNRSPQPGYMALAGLMSGFAAWTKNEGVVFLLAVIITLVIIFGLRKQRKDFIKILISFLLGLLLPLAVIIYFKWQLAPANDITSNQSLSIIVSKILDPQRYWIIFRYFGDIIYRLGEWDNPVIIAGLLYLFLFWDLGGQNRKGLWMATLVLVLTFAGYFSIYLITPHPLEWHLTYSVDRLVFHLFPMYLLIIFLATGTPEDLYEKITGSREEKRKALD
jgi:4-amino-4-deoxy-L-arabinose transferase-like glycosyltransferase